ncbi:hypothetical protein GCM10010211_20830 [Streptomyces albospinus]|uniref:Uncharacterized protein n=1 Tax=Streptomyces albospinus TaxID=285515 RepID=A0ABQ2UX12_9ACTN|nr:hypothetical protein GCM10010211_20830 [Streptomyces albospinus]
MPRHKIALGAHTMLEIPVPVHLGPPPGACPPHPCAPICAPGAASAWEVARPEPRRVLVPGRTGGTPEEALA